MSSGEWTRKGATHECSGEPGVPVLPEPAAQELEDGADASAANGLLVSQHPNRRLLGEIQLEPDKIWGDAAVEVRKKTDPIARSYCGQE